MRRRGARFWLKRIAIAGVALVLVGVVALEALRWTSKRRGVESVPLPPSSEIAALSGEADYTDAYRCAVAGGALNADQLIPPGENEVARTQNEVVQEGTAPGLRFLTSYVLEQRGATQFVTLSTAVFCDSPLGLIYFTPVRYVHRRAVPFALSLWSKRWAATDPR